MRFLISAYNLAVAKNDREAVPKIKWHRELENRRKSGQRLVFEDSKIRLGLYRPYCTRNVYFDKQTNSQSFRLHEIFRSESNLNITFLGVASSNPLAVVASSIVFDTCLLKNGNGSTQGAPRHRYTNDGTRLENITDWSLAQFRAHYGSNIEITKDTIFHYVYAVLHDPIYRETYAQNLKREFPRIPFYPDFAQWAAWGEKLMALHIGYETVAPWPLSRVDTPDAKARAAKRKPKPILKSNPETGVIVLDSETQLTGVPAAAWTYRLGNRSALDWILDQHKEKTPKDPTIREKFNTYRFADYKEKVVDLIARVTRVSVETVAITEAMRELRKPLVKTATGRNPGSPQKAQALVSHYKPS